MAIKITVRLGEPANSDVDKGAIIAGVNEKLPSGSRAYLLGASGRFAVVECSNRLVEAGVRKAIKGRLSKGFPDWRYV